MSSFQITISADPKFSADACLTILVYSNVGNPGVVLSVTRSKLGVYKGVPKPPSVVNGDTELVYIHNFEDGVCSSDGMTNYFLYMSEEGQFVFAHWGDDAILNQKAAIGTHKPFSKAEKLYVGLTTDQSTVTIADLFVSKKPPAFPSGVTLEKLMGVNAAPGAIGAPAPGAAPAAAPAAPWGIFDRIFGRSGDKKEDKKEDKGKKQRCMHGMRCHFIEDAEHTAKFFHEPLPCKHGPECKDHSAKHRAEFSHFVHL